MKLIPEPMARTRIILSVAALAAAALLAITISAWTSGITDPGLPGSRESVARTTDGDAVALDPSPATCRVEIQVMIAGDGEDRPAAGAWVRVDGAARGFAPDKPFSATVTDSDGNAVLILPGNQDWQIWVGREDLGPRGTVWNRGDPGVSFLLHPVTPLHPRVVDEDGRPIRGAGIYLEGTPLIAIARSDLEGRFDLAVGADSELLIRHFGRASTWTSAEALLASPVVVLRPGLTVAGIVIDCANHPIAGVSISLTNGIAEDVRFSADDGRFEFDGIAFDRTPCDEEVYLSFERAGFLGADVAAIPGDRTLRVVLDRPGSISGRVVFADGSCASGARVRCSCPEEHDIGKSVHAGADGSFRFDGVSPGLVVLTSEVWGKPPAPRWASEHCYDVERVMEIAPDTPLRDQTLVLSRVQLSFLTVKCLERDGSPSPFKMYIRGRVRQTYVYYEDGALMSERTLAIALPAFTPVDVTILPCPDTDQPDELRWVSRTLRTTASPTDPAVVVVLPGASQLTIHVRDARGRKLDESAEVSVSYSDCTTPEGRDLGGGDFVFDVPPGCMFSVEAGASGHGPDFRWHTAAEHPEEIEIRLRTAVRIRGRLILRDGGELPRVNVYAENHTWGRCLEPARDGRFALQEDAPAGRLCIGIHGLEGPALIRVVDAAPGDDIDLGDIHLDALPRLAGRVTGISGMPVAALVSLRSRRGYERVVSVATYRDGRFDLPYTVIPDGYLEIRARGHGRTYRQATASLRSPLVVRLQAEGRLRIALEPDEGCCKRMTLTAMLPGLPVIWNPPFVAVLDENGRLCFELTELPDGPVRVRCETTNSIGRTVVGEVEVRVVAGQVHTATITLRPEGE